MKKKVLRKMFKEDDERFAGYESIVSTLINDGQTITTNQGIDIDYGKYMSKYIELKPVDIARGSNLIEVHLDIDNAIKDERFTEILEEIKSALDVDIENYENNLALTKSLKYDVVDFMEEIKKIKGEK